MAVWMAIPLIIEYAKAFPPEKYPYLWGVSGLIYSEVVKRHPEIKEKWSEALRGAGIVMKANHHSPYSVVIEREKGLQLKEESVGIYETREEAMEVVEDLKKDRHIAVIVVADEGRQEIIYEWARIPLIEAYEIERGK